MTPYFDDDDLSADPPYWWQSLVIAIALAVLMVVCAAASAADARNIVITDGDTFKCDIALGFDTVIEDQAVRINAYDAWETSRRRQTVKITDAELAKGMQAKAALANLLHHADHVGLVEVKGRDPYGRRLLWVYADGKEVGAILRAQGHERK
jgi:endonuclease YncB( thermonuclease family)